MNRPDFSRTFEQLATRHAGARVLLHACCAPCSSYVLGYITQWFAVDLYYYNPNIAPECEYTARLDELRRLTREMPLPQPVDILPAPYDPETFYTLVRGLEHEPERGRRCTLCFRLRLRATAEAASRAGYDFFCTTLTISPLKDAALINAIGAEIADEIGIRYLPSDFKKHDGYRESIRLSRTYCLYRQNYCGCIFSRREAETRMTSKTTQSPTVTPTTPTTPTT